MIFQNLKVLYIMDFRFFQFWEISELSLDKLSKKPGITVDSIIPNKTVPFLKGNTSDFIIFTSQFITNLGLLELIDMCSYLDYVIDDENCPSKCKNF